MFDTASFRAKKEVNITHKSNFAQRDIRNISPTLKNAKNFDKPTLSSRNESGEEIKHCVKKPRLC